MSFDRFKRVFFEHAPIFTPTFLKVQAEFGTPWEVEFGLHLEKLFGDDETAYVNAVRGYSKFSLDAMRLQRLFNKKLRYEDVTYQDACANVYQNEDYMLSQYLPGTFVSHFLWRHHYRMFVYYKENFLPLLDASEDKRFYEVGTGTGFYTLQVFRHDRSFHGNGIDISPHSRRFTLNNARGWGFAESLTQINLDIIDAELEPLPFIQSIEVLEHLTDPQLYLNSMRRLMKPGGRGYIGAALTAPNPDHIYLYWTPDEVIKQLVAAGFTVDDYREEPGYEGRRGEHVPKVAGFIVS